MGFGMSMTTPKHVLIVVVLQLLLATVRSDPLIQGMVDWIRSEGGFFNDKLEIRRVVMSDNSSYFGVFATQEIDAQERLLGIPHSCYIALWDEAMEGDDQEGEKYYGNLCLLTKKLMREMELGKDSKYAPYVAYLQSQKRGQIPATWSQPGKDMLRQLLAPGSDGVDFIHQHFADCIDKDDLLQEHAVAMVVQRGFDVELIPLWDMINHNNALVNTEHGSVRENGIEGMLDVQASRTIHPGEELYSTYDMCADCGNEAEYWGTPEILRDFGFVEPYPQRWVFLDGDVYFEVDEEDDGELSVWWDDGEDDQPDKQEIRFLEQHLDQVKRMEHVVLNERESAPQTEWDVIFQFFKAKTAAMSAALDSLKDHDQEL